MSESSESSESNVSNRSSGSSGSSGWPRRRLLGTLAAIVAAAAAYLGRATSVLRAAEAPEPSPGGAGKDFTPLELPDSAWKQLLPAASYDVLFEEATEKPFSSPLNDEKRAGTFICAACYLPLFSSKTKFDSGTGWPSFWDHLPGRLGEKTDFKLLLPRTEYHCARCTGHQGHVFDDGPEPTGLRYCNNGVALQFVPDGEPLPALRQAT
ncbi:MAG: peptide-methionine (R)-S-oxide reductase MsrB [Deltaproteobacteria bacterium]|nr:peptide-methionine (R)-S-oxide reductase MsrB [Deltaproteobacteria bacterium]